MAGERLITFNAYYLLIFQISPIILIILPRQLFSQKVTFLWKVELPFSLVHILLRIFSALREKKIKKNKETLRWRFSYWKESNGEEYWLLDISPLVTVTVFFFRIFAFSSTLTRERIFETAWGVGNLLCDTLTCNVWCYKCSSHFPNCVYADCKSQKKKKKKTMPLTFVVNEEALIDLKCAKTYI